MTEAHIGSVLPIANRVLAADNDTTFLAHYDLNEHDVLRGVKALGFQSSLEMDGTLTHVALPHEEAHNVRYITIEAWVYLDTYGVGDNSHHMIMNKESAYELGITKSDGKLQAAISPNWVWRGGLTVPLKKWVYVSCSYDGQDLRFCVDDQSETLSASNKGPMGKVTQGLGIGARGINAVGNPTGYSKFGGKIAEVRLWNVGKTIEEMQKSKVTQPNSDSASLVGHWKMNEGEGVIVRDSSWVRRDGVVTGTVKWSTGNSIFTLRPKEGKFGGAIAVEEGTQNLIPNSAKWDGWRATGYEGNTCDMEIIESGGNHILHIYNVRQPSNSGYPRVTGPTLLSAVTGPVSAGFSTYSSKPGELNVRFYESGSTKNNIVLSTQEKWIRNEGSFSTTFLLDTAYLVPKEGCEYWLSSPQIENKEFPTSYVDGQRTSGFLSYPKELVAGKESLTIRGLFSFSTGLSQGNSDARMLWSCGFHTSPIASDYLYLRRMNTTNRLHFRIQSVVGGENYTLNGNQALESNRFYDIAFTFHQGRIKLYIDGVLDAEYQTSLAKTPDFLGVHELGIGVNPNYQPEERQMNGMIDELRIDKVARTDEEILAWYQSNSPFWPRGIYRKSY